MKERESLIYAGLPDHKALISKTKKFVKWALGQVKKPYLACSFGKDSSVMLHLVLEYAPEIPVRFATHPETNLLDDYERVINWWKEQHNINFVDVFCDGGFVKVKHHQRKMLDNGDWDSFFLGIRAEESKGRRISLKMHGDFHNLANGRTKICPLAWWKEKDVAAYIFANKLPLLDKYAFEGVEARTTSGIARTHLHETMVSLRNRDLQRFNELIKLYPDAAYFI